MGDLAARLFPDFGRGGVVMGVGIGWIAVLVGIKISFRVRLVNFADTADGAVGGFVAGRIDNINAVGLQNMFAFGRRARREAKLHAIAERRADHGVGDSGVAASGIENYFSG